MVFWKLTPNLTITSCKFGSNFEVFWNFFKKPLKVPSLARSVQKPLKVPSLARSVPKPLKVPSSVPEPLKVPSLARSLPKPLSIFGRSRSAPAVVTTTAVDPLPAGCEVKWKVKSEVKWKWKWKVMLFWSFIFPETYICYRGYFNLNFYIGKKVQKNFLMGLKIWWSWGSGIFFFQNHSR